MSTISGSEITSAILGRGLGQFLDRSQTHIGHAELHVHDTGAGDIDGLEPEVLGRWRAKKRIRGTGHDHRTSGLHRLLQTLAVVGMDDPSFSCGKDKQVRRQLSTLYNSIAGPAMKRGPVSRFRRGRILPTRVLVPSGVLGLGFDADAPCAAVSTASPTSSASMADRTAAWPHSAWHGHLEICRAGVCKKAEWRALDAGAGPKAGVPLCHRQSAGAPAAKRMRPSTGCSTSRGNSRRSSARASGGAPLLPAVPPDRKSPPHIPPDAPFDRHRPGPRDRTAEEHRADVECRGGLRGNRTDPGRRGWATRRPDNRDTQGRTDGQPALIAAA